MPADVVQLIGNPRSGSRTRTLADTVAETLLARLADREVQLQGRANLELGEIVTVSFASGPAGTGGTDRTPVGDTVGVTDPFEAVRSARLLVVATPTYKGTYTGLLKVFLDQFRQGDLSDVVAVGVAIAASEAHRRAVAATLQDLLAALGARVPAEPVALLEPETADAAQLVNDWADKYADPIAAALSLPRPGRRAVTGPGRRRRTGH